MNHVDFRARSNSGFHGRASRLNRRSSRQDKRQGIRYCLLWPERRVHGWQCRQNLDLRRTLLAELLEAPVVRGLRELPDTAQLWTPKSSRLDNRQKLPVVDEIVCLARLRGHSSEDARRHFCEQRGCIRRRVAGAQDTPNRTSRSSRDMSMGRGGSTPVIFFEVNGYVEPLSRQTHC